MRGRAIVTAAATAALLAAFGRPALAQSGELTFLAVSDIHLNPFDRWPLPRKFGSDANRALFDSAIAQMKLRVPHPDVVVLPGDFLAHDFKQLIAHYRLRISADAAGIAAAREIAAALQRAYPNAQFAVAVGNNDAPCGDYRVDAGDAFAAAVARIWEPLVDRRTAAPDFVRAFTAGGYYTAALPGRRMRLVVVNSVLFSSVYQGSCNGDAVDAGASERAWLARTLATTPAGSRNVVMMHVPVGYDVFSTETTHGYLPWTFLRGRDNDALLGLLRDPANRVAFALAGHAHRFDFRLAGHVPMLVLGSISPVYDSNPQFYALHVGLDGSLRDVDAYAFDEWTQRWIVPPSFDRAWNVERLDAAALTRIHAHLESDAALRARWDEASDGWPSRRTGMVELWGRYWRVAWCAQTVLAAGFEPCAGIARRAEFARVAAAAALLALLGGVAGLVVAMRRRRRARAR